MVDRRTADLYIRQNFAAEDAHLQKIRRITREHGLPGVHITAEEGHMLGMLLRMIGARRVVEVGTLAGYSATWIARSLPPEGHLTTCEFNPDHATLAQSLFTEANLTDRITIAQGPALETLTTLTTPIDALFIDADKTNLMAYFRWGLLNIRPGGLILAHNAFMRGRIFEENPPDPMTGAMHTFTQALQAHPRVAATVIPIGDGFIVGHLLS